MQGNCKGIWRHKSVVIRLDGIRMKHRRQLLDDDVFQVSPRQDAGQVDLDEGLQPGFKFLQILR